MKKHIILLFLSLGLFAACDMVSGEGEGTDNAVYMGNANSSGIISMVVNNEKGGSAVITPRLANITDQPVEITVEVDKQLLEEYNAKTGLALEPMSVEDFVFVTKDKKETHGKAVVTIGPGQYNASVEVKIPRVDENKYPYSKRFAIPVSVTHSSMYKLLSSPKSTIIRLSRELVTSVGRFSRAGSIALVPNDELRKPMNNWTMQVSMLYLRMTSSNQTVMSISSGTGDFYTRINEERGIQIKNGRDGDDTWTDKPLSRGKWLNISFVHKDASSISVYVNGELQKTFETSPIYFSNIKKCCLYIGNTEYSGVYIREARMWNRALTEGEIIDKEYLPQDPTDPSLIMYMPFNTVENNEMKELTGNWEISDFRTLDIWDEDPPQMSYVENVQFPAEDLIIVEE